MAPLKLVYFPLAGRGELIRLVAAAGGVDLEERYETPWREYCTTMGMPEMLPILEHGDLVLCQSGAIERYVSSLAPKYQCLTPAEKAIDDMFACTKEDIIQGLATLIFRARDTCPEEVPKVVDKLYTFLESRVPETGFVHGHDFPTMADLVVFNVVKAAMPMGVAFKLANFNDLPSKCPKLVRLADDVANASGVKEYLASTTSLLGVAPAFKDLL